MYDVVVVHYDEIGLKGKNRQFFEKLLVSNIKKKLGDELVSCKRESGQLTIELAGSDIDKVTDILSKIPGIAFFSFAKKASLEGIENEIVTFAKNFEFESFKIDARRHNKRYKHTSMELNKVLGSAVYCAFEKEVKMKSPDLKIKVEIGDNSAYFSVGNVQGVGGLPTSPKIKVMTLLSGGFDSPVAAFMMMKRGSTVSLVHFHNQKPEYYSVESKIKNIAEQLSKFQINTELYIVPFVDIQKQLIMHVPAKVRMLIYRRMMLRIAARLDDSKFLIVGDSLSQVASQTIQNLEAVYHCSEKPIFAPLIGLNKREILDISKKIGIYDISALPYEDCCSFFLAKSPELKARVQDLEKYESSLDIESLCNKGIEKTTHLTLTPQ